MRALATALMLAAAPARAGVSITDAGFVTENSAVVAAAPAAVWAALVEPARYWDPAHTYSSNARNVTLDARAGGCFCESFGKGGSIEHMRVVMVMPETQLRLVGGLGPLQSEGLAGVLTWTLKPVDGGTEITQTYVVGGYMRQDRAQMAPLVGQVLGEQLTRLAALFAAK
jgi:uncharacterized protein YndB with AHSA1/START domain